MSQISVKSIKYSHQIFTSNIHKYLSNIHLSWGYASLFASSNFRMWHWSNILKRLSARDLVVTMVVRTSLFRRCAETESFLIRGGVIQCCSFRSSRLRSALLKLWFLHRESSRAMLNSVKQYCATVLIADSLGNQMFLLQPAPSSEHELNPGRQFWGWMPPATSFLGNRAPWSKHGRGMVIPSWMGFPN
jgi:hypothetical protein